MCPDRRLRQISLRPKSWPWTWSSLHSTNDGKQHDERLQLDEDARSGGRIDLDECPPLEVRSDDREQKLNDGAVDLVLASYSITPDRAMLVTFSGPYYVAHQDIMVRRGETAIRNVRDLAGRRMCQASGSVSTERVVKGRNGVRPAAQMVQPQRARTGRGSASVRGLFMMSVAMVIVGV